MDKRILVVGDSHSKFWTGQNNLNIVPSIFPGMDVVRLGPITALGLPSKKSPVPASISKLIDESPVPYGLIITCFSEVDIRAHAVALALLRRTSLDTIADDVVDCYMQFVDTLYAQHGIPVAIWGPPPSRPHGGRAYNRGVPVVGTPLERNYVTRRITEGLETKCEQRDHVGFFSVFADLVGPDLRTLPGALFDGCHLNNTNMPLAVTRLRALLARMGLRALDECLATAVEIASDPTVLDLSTHAFWKDDAPGERLPALSADLQSAFVIRSISLQKASSGVSDHALIAVEANEIDRRVTLFDIEKDRDKEADHGWDIAVAGGRPIRFLTFLFEAKPPIALSRSIAIYAPVFSTSLV